MKLELEPTEVQYLLNLCAERPYKESAPIIQKIIGQVNAAPQHEPSVASPDKTE